MFIDTHCHLTMLGKDKNERDLVVSAAKSMGVGKIITIGTTLNDSINSAQIAGEYEGVFATAGIHPCDTSQEWPTQFEEIKKLVLQTVVGVFDSRRFNPKKENKIVGIGETGLDFYHKPFDKKRQVASFTAHIELAIENDLPLVIHMRDSSQEVLRVLEPYKNKVRGVAHCFVQPKDIADVLLEWGFYLGIGGPLSYPKNESLRELYDGVSLERIVLETDAPFLPPQAFRGKKNHPRYIPMIAEVIAKIKGIESEQVERVTTQNAQNLFQI